MTKLPRTGSGKKAPMRAEHSNPAVEAHLTLIDAEAARKSGKLSKALALCKGLLQKYPDFFGAHHSISLVYRAQNDVKNTIGHLVVATALNPSNSNLQLDLALTYIENGDILAARRLASAELQQYPESEYAMFTFGKVIIANAEFDLALDHYKSFVKKFPKNNDALIALGRVYNELGMQGEAINAFQQSARKLKLQMGTLGALSRFPKEQVEIDIEKYILALDAAQTTKSARYKLQRGFAWANMLINKGSFKEGFRELKKVNLMQFKLVEKDVVRGINERKRIHEIVKKLPVSAAQQPKISKNPVNVIIFGPSRSGKTTLERLLGTLPSVSRGFETKLISRAIKKTYMDAAFPILSRANDLPKPLENGFRKNFLQAVAEITDGKSAYVCTHPGRIIDAHRIATTIPNTRLIFIKRNIDDVVFRMFATKYSNRNDHTYDLETAREYVNWYYEIQDMLLTRLPNVSMVINYEDMAENPAATLEKVKSFCGIGGEIGELPNIGDDRGCSKPFLEFMENE